MQDKFKAVKKFLYSLIAVGLGILMVVAFTLPGAVVGNRSQSMGSVNGKSIEISRGSLYANHYYRLIEYYKSQGVSPSKALEKTLQQQGLQGNGVLGAHYGSLPAIRHSCERA